MHFLVELQLLEVKPRTASRGIRSPYLPTCILKSGIKQYWKAQDETETEARVILLKIIHLTSS
jgi:hypothetical protein